MYNMRENVFKYSSLYVNMKLLSVISNKPRNEEGKYRLLCARSIFLCVCIILTMSAQFCDNKANKEKASAENPRI